MTDSDLIKIIADGGPALGKSPQTPAYRGTLSTTQIKAVVAYLRSIAGSAVFWAEHQVTNSDR